MQKTIKIMKSSGTRHTDSFDQNWLYKQVKRLVPFLSEVVAQTSDPLCCTLVMFQQMGTSTSTFQIPITCQEVCI